MIAADIQGPVRFLNCDAPTFSIPWQEKLLCTQNFKGAGESCASHAYESKLDLSSRLYYRSATSPARGLTGFVDLKRKLRVAFGLATYFSRKR